jgi:serine/threonine protein kinase
MEKHTQLPPSIDYQRLEFLAFGGVGTVYAIDEKRVFKEFYNSTIDIERRALKRLGLHPNIIQCFGAVDNSLILKRGQTIRSIIQERGVDQIPLSTKICWLQQAAQGTGHMHDNSIIYTNVGCQNWIMVEGHLKVIDFEGCSIDKQEAGAIYE